MEPNTTPLERIEEIRPTPTLGFDEPPKREYKKNYLTEEDEKNIIQDYLARTDLGVKKVAALHNINDMKLYAILKKHNAPRRNNSISEAIRRTKEKKAQQTEAQATEQFKMLGGSILLRVMGPDTIKVSNIVWTDREIVLTIK